MFVRRVATHAALRGLSALYVMDRARKFLDVSITASDRIKFKAPNDEAFVKADRGEMVLLAPGEDPYIRALIKLTAFDGRYLYISRNVDADVLRQLEKARESKVEFDQLLNQRQGVQVTFGLMYAGVALVFLLSAVWTGLWFADRLVEPIINLVNAARRVAVGDFREKVPTRDGPSDLQTLGRTFNQMTDQLDSQRSDLMSANQQLDDRRRFTEAMLAGVSAGVIGIDPSGRVDLGEPIGGAAARPARQGLPRSTAAQRRAAADGPVRSGARQALRVGRRPGRDCDRGAAKEFHGAGHHRKIGRRRPRLCSNVR